MNPTKPRAPRILAINVSLRPNSPVKIFPVGLAYVLSGLSSQGVSFEVFDVDALRPSPEQIINRLSQGPYDIVLLGAIVTGYSTVKRLTADIRRTNPAALIVVGNSVASSIPEILLNHTETDVAVMGEGEVTALEVVKAWMSGRDIATVEGVAVKRAGRVVRTKDRQLIQSLDEIPLDYDIFNVETYIDGLRSHLSDPLPLPRDQLRPFTINSARGCINRCGFCYHVFIGSRFRHKSTEAVLADIRRLKRQYGINYIWLWDDLSFYSRRHVADFVAGLERERLDIFFAGNIRANLFHDESDLELLRRAKAVGCVRFGYSLESANAEILAAMNKNSSLEQFRRQKELLDAAGIASATSIVLGYPQETLKTLDETFGFCLDIGLYPSSGYLLPQPGTPIYDYAKSIGRITDEEEYLLAMGDRQDLRVNLTAMSDSEFEGAVRQWLARLNRELRLGLSDDGLIKTQYYRAAGISSGNQSS
ncbi:MAG: B12-binding domain-containing radical SAM protein [Desulfovibrio sp.]|nr:B12-binding domain-containing radical SAM protein [Desulfovibrio sp.]MBI4959115.1 B12-binding domain-containing radical SAM protein [Desulfovibrio sp.]